MRVELWPFGQVVRPGGRIRITVEAPTALPELWGFAFLPVPALNTIYHDAAHPSSLALPVVHDVQIAEAQDPTCGTVIRQPCR